MFETLEKAILHLGSSAFNGYIYADVALGVLMYEISICKVWYETTGGIVERHPDSESVRVATLCLQLKGDLAVSNQDFVVEALTVLDMSRIDGRLHPSSVNNYMALKYALEFGDCDDPGIVGMAKAIVETFKR